MNGIVGIESYIGIFISLVIMFCLYGIVYMLWDRLFICVKFLLIDVEGSGDDDEDDEFLFWGGFVLEVLFLGGEFGDVMFGIDIRKL